METRPDLPKALVISLQKDKVEVYDLQGKSFTKELPAGVIFIPTLLIDQRLISRNYDLYVFPETPADFKEKINAITQTKSDAIILIGKSDDRIAYFIEDQELIEDANKIRLIYNPDQLKVDQNGKALANSELEQTLLSRVIREIRLKSGVGNEVEITGARTGANIFSHSFGPCNAVVANRKSDHQFVLYHADDTAVDKIRGVGKFLESIQEGKGFNFLYVMQNPNVQRNIKKAPLIAGKMAVALQDTNVQRIEFPEGYNAIACINGKTMILTNNMTFYKNDSEKKSMAKTLQTEEKKEKQSRKIEPSDLIPMTETLKTVKDINKEMKNIYRDVIKDLEKLGVKEKPGASKKSFFGFKK